MKKIASLLLMLFVVTALCGQGLKGVNLGDYGLTAPLWGKDKIETTLLEGKGILEVFKSNSKIYRIEFKFYNNRGFTQEMADQLANSLVEKYKNIKLTKIWNGNWIDKDESEINIFIQAGDKYDKYHAVGENPYNAVGVVEMANKKIQEQVWNETESNQKKDF